MTQSYEGRGYFYRPGSPDKAVAGKLVANEDEISVQLDGTLLPVEELIKVTAKYTSIHAVMQDSKKVSLFGVHQNSAGMGGYPREGWWVSYGVLGAHFDQEQPAFDEVHFQLDHLPEWVSRTGLSTKALDDNPRHWQVTSQPPELVSATLPDQTELAVGFGGEMHSRLHRVELEEHVYAIGKAPAPMSARQITEAYVAPIRDLITFATLAPAVIEEVNVRSAEHQVNIGDGGAMAKQDFPLFHRMMQPEPTLRDRERRYPDHMLFALDDWPGSFDDLVNRWFALRAELAPALNLVMGLGYAPPRWSDTVVLTWAQTFEAYHRIRYHGEKSEQVAQARYKRVMESCSAADREWLRVRLEHADEPSLRRRVKDVADRVKQVVDPLLNLRKTFGDSLSEARNAYSHFGAAANTPGGTGPELYDLAQCARWIFLGNILLDLGFDEASAKALLNRNVEFRHLLEGPNLVALS